MTGARLYHGSVIHIRHAAPRHRFAYRIWMLAADLDALDDLAASSRLFRHNRFGLIAFHDRDFGPRDGTPLLPWARAALDDAGLGAFGARVRLLAIPRVLGHAFNPISFFFCYDSEGRLGAVLHHVRNTFGDHVVYRIAVPQGAARIRQRAAKAMHVSPFFDMEGRYDFSFTPPGETFSIGIAYSAGARRLTAAMRLQATRFSDRAALALLARMPLTASTILAAIHIEALRLLLRRARFHRRPERRHASIVTGDAV